MDSGLAHPSSCLQCQPYCAAQVRHRNNSSKCCSRWSVGSDSPLASGGERWGEVASFHHLYHHIPYNRSMTCSPIFIPSGPSCPFPCEQGLIYCATQLRCRMLSPTCFTWWEAGQILLSVSANQGWSQVCTALPSLPLLVSRKSDSTICVSIRAMNLGMEPSCSSSTDITKSLNVNQATYFSLLLTTLNSSDLTLCMGNEPYEPTPFSSITHHTFISP